MIDHENPYQAPQTTDETPTPDGHEPFPLESLLMLLAIFAAIYLAAFVSATLFGLH